MSTFPERNRIDRGGGITLGHWACACHGDAVCSGCPYFTTAGCSCQTQDEDFEMLMQKNKNLLDLLAK